MKRTNCFVFDTNVVISSLSVSAKAKCIIAGDKDLLVLNPFKNIFIVAPAEFLEKF